MPPTHTKTINEIQKGGMTLPSPLTKRVLRKWSLNATFDCQSPSKVLFSLSILIRLGIKESSFTTSYISFPQKLPSHEARAP